MEAEEEGFDEKDSEPILKMKFNGKQALDILENEASEGDEQ